MLRNPIDVATRVSPELSAFIAGRVNDPDNDQPVTLGSARAYLARILSSETKETERLHHIDSGDSLLDEIESLCEEYGATAAAVDFIGAEVSESLSRVIDAVLNDEGRDNPPTLDTVREAMASGLVARLVGEGAIEDDEDETLFSEIEDLARRYGPDALAEGFIRYD